MGNPASSTNRDVNPSYEQACARILLGSLWASSIIVRSRDACIDGIAPRTFGSSTVTSRPRPAFLLDGVVIRSSNLKG